MSVLPPTPTHRVNTIGIVGLGLIGGCLALDFKQLGYTVYGVARRPATASTAMEQGIVTQASCDLTLMATADMVFVCTPMAVIVATVGQLAEYLSESAIVTDVGSVKGEIVAAATELWPNFVGSHPMAGKAESGLAAAESGLFQQRPYVVTPIDTSRSAAVDQVVEIATQLGSKIYTATPSAHDRAVAAISHLPVMVSASLLHTCTSEPDTHVKTLAQQLASSGFCDTSRVGGGNPDLGTMMAQYNRPALLATLRQYRQQLDSTIELIEAEQWEALATRLGAAQQERPKYL
ncbi:prephenate/arogenate dehydrogenase [Leptolyngbya cf. ectocarpi LEGE 11479]|uniref:Prephenate/arogenate dehydrogenase n=1 Tax=Leptolyngbya cf. ectocarpi LEGE 11479 TaxID=1828722 RepID=A0A928WZF5_LEPEC|nr:prephenate/arogenate dehydrogenase [Leptolyngbya ectocarpi]MBE9065672.1 prephenate/arogenate dehydrogenase [Leptolyngbya cf. ectocarpi LEGE 11479]